MLIMIEFFSVHSSLLSTMSDHLPSPHFTSTRQKTRNAARTKLLGERESWWGCRRNHQQQETQIHAVTPGTHIDIDWQPTHFHSSHSHPLSQTLLSSIVISQV